MIPEQKIYSSDNRERTDGREMNSRTVDRRWDGTWINRVTGASKATSMHKTPDEAIATAKRMLADSGGGELRIKGAGGYVIRVELVASDFGTK